MKLVPNIRQAWRWISVQAFAALMAFPFVWTQIPADAKARIPEWLDPWIPATLAAIGLIGRLKDQGTSNAE